MACVGDVLDWLLAEGRSAVASGDWATARSCFEDAVDHGGSAAALDELAQVLFTLGDYTGSIGCSEQAYARYRVEGDDLRAAVCARFVGYLYGVVHGNGSKMSGWLARAVRLIDGVGDCPERARIELTMASVSSDPVVRERHLAAAAEIALRHGDTDTGFDVMSQRGLHLVARGDVAAGMALLGEALAAVAGGEVQDLVAVGSMYCKMLHACELTRDVRRAEEWLESAEGFVARTHRLPISAICRTHYGGVLVAAGRWAEAEAELVTSIELYDRTYRALRGAAVVRLAGLRVRQGRLDEAAQLLLGAEHDTDAITASIELHLARGEADLAVARIERFLRGYAESELTAPTLLLLVRAHLDRSHTSGAAEAALQLRGLAVGAQRESVVVAMAEYADGLVAAAEDPAKALAHLEAALAAFGRLGLPLEQARTRLDLARALTATQPAMALREGRTALECFQALSATRDADAATSVLRQLGVRGHTGPRGAALLTAREQDVLDLLGQGLTNPDIATRLFVSRRTVEHHVSNILAKLGLRNRTEVAAYVMRQATDR